MILGRYFYFQSLRAIQDTSSTAITINRMNEIRVEKKKAHSGSKSTSAWKAPTLSKEA